MYDGWQIRICVRFPPGRDKRVSCGRRGDGYLHAVAQNDILIETKCVPLCSVIFLKIIVQNTVEKCLFIHGHFRFVTAFPFYGLSNRGQAAGVGPPLKPATRARNPGYGPPQSQQPSGSSPMSTFIARNPAALAFVNVPWSQM